MLSGVWELGGDLPWCIQVYRCIGYVSMSDSVGRAFKIQDMLRLRNGTKISATRQDTTDAANANGRA